MPHRSPEPASSGPDDPATDDAERLDGGEFGAWLDGIEAAIRGGRDSDVPCGGCTACCTASQFVHIGNDERDTLAHVPSELTFPAPGLPDGHVLLGYDQRGHCPMLVGGACSIYAHRPRTCRTYDCRVFAATGVRPAETKIEIADRVGRWHFRVADDRSRIRRAAVEGAADVLRTRAADLHERGIVLPSDPTQLAVLAIEIHGAFLAADATGDLRLVDPTVEIVAASVAAVRARHEARPET